MIDVRTGTVDCARLNGTAFLPSVTIVMYCQARSLYLVAELIVRSQPPDPVAGRHPGQIGRTPLPILYRNDGIDFVSLKSPYPVPDCESRMPNAPEPTACSTLLES